MFIPDERNLLDTKSVGIYKSKEWIFQQECRFKTSVFSKSVFSSLNPLTINTNAINDIISLDVKFSDSAYDNMQILLGPNVTESEKIIVETLMEKFLGRTNYEMSCYTGKMVK